MVEGAGFTFISEENITPRILPMLQIFHRWGIIPYMLLKWLGLQKLLVNAMAGVEGYRAMKKDVWRYVIVVAQKPTA